MFINYHLSSSSSSTPNNNNPINHNNNPTTIQTTTKSPEIYGLESTLIKSPGIMMNPGSQVTFNLNPKSPQPTPTDPTTEIIYTANDFIAAAANNNNMRRDRSLDRCTMTDSSAADINMRRSYFTNNYLIPSSSVTQPSTPQHQNFPAYVNSTLYLNNATGKQQPGSSANLNRNHQQHHHRSNSILANNLITSNQSAFNGFTRDSALRHSSRALSSNNFMSPPTTTTTTTTNLNHTTTNQSAGSVNFLPNEFSSNQVNSSQPGTSKLSFIKDLQIRLMDIQKECYFLRCELDASQTKLASSMQSIKQFWSPELKKERQLRKEEAGKYQILLEQYKSLLESYEQQSINIQQLQLQQDDLSLSSSQSSKQVVKEKSLLKKTINELEMRISAQKQSLTTKDETIKKLFQLVKTLSNKAANAAVNTTSGAEHEMEAINGQLLLNDQTILKERLIEEERKNLQLQQCIQQIKQQHAQLMSQLANSSNTNISIKLEPSSDNHSNEHQSLLMEANGGKSADTSRMKQLEVQMQHLQDELTAVKTNADVVAASNSTLNSTHASPHSIGVSTSQMELMKSNEKFLKEKVSKLK